MSKALYMRDNEKLGKLGEELVAKLLDLTLSEDKYDMKKDGVTSDGTYVEIKTQNRHPRGYFTVRRDYSNQLKKCKSVDRLIFVEYDSTNDIKIWECHDRNHIEYDTKSGLPMAGWHIKDMELLHIHNDPELANKMKKLSSAKQFTNA